jgi:hypothetical protein
MRLTEVNAFAKSRLSGGLSAKDAKDLVAKIAGDDGKLNARELAQTKKVHATFASDFTPAGEEAFAKEVAKRLQGDAVTPPTATFPKLQADSTSPMLFDVKVSGKQSIDCDFWMKDLDGMTQGLVLSVKIGDKMIRVDADKAFDPPPGVDPTLWDMTPTAQGLASALAQAIGKAGYNVSMDYVGIGDSTMRLTLAPKS